MKKILFIFALLILNIAVCNAEDTVITLKMYSCKSRTPEPIWFNYYPERSAEQTCMPLARLPQAMSIIKQRQISRAALRIILKV